MADTKDSKSFALKAWGFKSLYQHQFMKTDQKVVLGFGIAMLLTFLFTGHYLMFISFVIVGLVTARLFKGI